MVSKTRIDRRDWGNVNGKPVYLFTFQCNDQCVGVTNYGGIVTSWMAPDNKGKVENIVLGFDALNRYLEKHPHFGAITGRVANRISGAAFTIDGQQYVLEANKGINHIHGGRQALDKRVWEAAVINDDTLELTYLSEDGEQGYPGNLQLKVCYRFNEEQGLHIDYTATTDKTTPVNLTNHAYFNLSGNWAQDILDHKLLIHAASYTPINNDGIPTGEIASVTDTPFDFRTPHLIGERIQSAGGYDHNYVLDNMDKGLRSVATVHHGPSGRSLEVLTDLPGMQLYTGNNLTGTPASDSGHPIGKHAGLCLETQAFPDAVNQPAFPSILLYPGQVYHTVTAYRLTVQ